MTVTGSAPGLDAEAAKAAASSAVDRVNEAWASGDADAFAAAYTESGTMALSGDRYFRGRADIQARMSMAFAGPLKGTRLAGEIVDLRLLAPGVAVLATEGGILAPGEEQVVWERALRATWVVVEQDGDWLIAAYQNGRRADGAVSANWLSRLTFPMALALPRTAGHRRGSA
jgi:uncharacterized protein (TIGR02246 family)